MLLRVCVIGLPTRGVIVVVVGTVGVVLGGTTGGMIVVVCASVMNVLSPEIAVLPVASVDLTR